MMKIIYLISVLCLIIGYFLFCLYRDPATGALRVAEKSSVQFLKGVTGGIVLETVALGACGLAGGGTFLSRDIGWYVVFWVVMYTALAALFEEMLCRGILLSLIMKVAPKSTPYLAVVAQALIFAGLHMTSLRFPPFVFSVFFFAVIAGFVTVRSNTLWCAIGLHFSWDLLHILMFGNSTKFIPQFGALLQFPFRHSLFAAMVLGIVAAIYLLLDMKTSTKVLLEKPSATLRRFWRVP